MAAHGGSTRDFDVDSDSRGNITGILHCKAHGEPIGKQPYTKPMAQHLEDPSIVFREQPPSLMHFSMFNHVRPILFHLFFLMSLAKCSSFGRVDATHPWNIHCITGHR